MTRTQDIRVIQVKFTQPTVLPQTGNVLPGHEICNFDDKVLDLVIKQDDLYAAFKTNRHSNFKKGYVNTLGPFETGSIYSLTKNWHAIIAIVMSHLKTDSAIDSKLIVEQTMTEEEAKGTSENFVSSEYAGQADYVKSVIAGGFLNKVQACLVALTAITKVSGQAAEESANALI